MSPSAAVTWQPSSMYMRGDRVFVDGQTFTCTSSGISGKRAPQNVGIHFSDGTCNWKREE